VQPHDSSHQSLMMQTGTVSKSTGHLLHLRTADHPRKLHCGSSLSLFVCLSFEWVGRQTANRTIIVPQNIGRFLSVSIIQTMPFLFFKQFTFQTLLCSFILRMNIILKGQHLRYSILYWQYSGWFQWTEGIIFQQRYT
jgi:hypothetical protein